MIDIETQVIDRIIRAVKAEYPNAIVQNTFTPTPSGFPYVAVYEMNNTNPTRLQDNTHRELYANVSYEAQIYANDPTKKATAKAIAQIVDNTMQDMGFLRTFMNPIPNIDRTIYRIVLRYSGVVQDPTYGGQTNVTYIYHR